MWFGLKRGFYLRRVRVARSVCRSGVGSPAGLDRVGMPGWDKLVMEDNCREMCDEGEISIFDVRDGMEWSSDYSIVLSCLVCNVLAL